MSSKLSYTYSGNSLCAQFFSLAYPFTKTGSKESLFVLLFALFRLFSCVHKLNIIKYIYK